MDRTDLRFSGWGLIAISALLMGTSGIYQFGWSSIRLPFGMRVGAPEPALGTVLTLFVITQTLGQFPAGWVRDRFGPRVPLLAGAVCLAFGFVGIAIARSLTSAYIAYAIGGFGVSIAYSISMNTAVKWFDDKRGLATGVVGMSFAGLSFLLIPAIRIGVKDAFEPTLVAMGVGTGGVALLAAVVLRDPPTAVGDGGTDAAFSDTRAWTVREAIQTRQFWLLYAVFAVVNGVGLMIIGKVISFAVALSLPETAATASASLVALADAAGVLFGGALSDHLGRRRTVTVSLVLSGVALAGAVTTGSAGFAGGFVVLIAAAAFFRGPTFSVFPSIIADYYGKTYSSENYAALYTAKLFGGVFGGTATSGLVIAIGWTNSFAFGAGLMTLAGLTLTFLHPIRSHTGSSQNSGV